MVVISSYVQFSTKTISPVNSLQKSLGWENFHGDAVTLEQRDLITEHLKGKYQEN